MPHLIVSHEGAAAQIVASLTPPFGPEFPSEVVEQTERLEVWGSGLNDAGCDYCIFKAFAADGNEIKTRTLGGY